MTEQESSSEEDRLVEKLYDRMIDSISTDVACGMHRMVKTGAISYSDLMNPKSRRDIYPSIHKSDHAMEESLHEYVTEVPPSKRLRRKASMEISSSEHNATSEDAAVVAETDTNEQSTTMVTRGHANINTTHDIWGRIPPKEPKTTAKCPVCSRQISTLRFAPHLDKCMGIGTMSRAAAQNHSILS